MKMKNSVPKKSLPSENVHFIGTGHCTSAHASAVVEGSMTPLVTSQKRFLNSLSKMEKARQSEQTLFDNLYVSAT